MDMGIHDERSLLDNFTLDNLVVTKLYFNECVKLVVPKFNIHETMTFSLMHQICIETMVLSMAS